MRRRRSEYRELARKMRRARRKIRRKTGERGRNWKTQKMKSENWRERGRIPK